MRDGSLGAGAGILALAAVAIAACGCGLVLDLAADPLDGLSADASANDGPADGMPSEGGVPSEGGMPSEGGVPSDGATSPDGSRPCEALHDDFEDMAVGPEWEAFADAPVAMDETGGVLVIEPAALEPEPAYAGYSSRPLNLTGGAVEVRAARVTNADSWSEMFFQISDGSWLMLFGYSYGRMVCRTERTDHSDRDMVLPPFDPETDLYWRIRHEGDWLVCETSADRVEWREKERRPNHLDLTEVRFSPYAGTWGSETDPGVAHYDDARAYGPSLCP